MMIKLDVSGDDECLTEEGSQVDMSTITGVIIEKAVSEHGEKQKMK